jgi:cell division protease FtsH
MVCEWGMSELGPLSFGKKEEQIFLGREIAQHRDYSEETAIRIDQQVRHMVDEQYQRAKQLIESHRDAMIRIAEGLLEREILDGDEVRQLIAGASVNTLPASEDGPDSGVQQIVKPVRVPGIIEGESPQPA